MKKSLCSLIAFLSFGPSLFAQVNLTQGLTLYLPFSNNLTDGSGNGSIVSKVNGGPGYTFDRQNNLNSALLFSNTGALKINASNNSLNFGTTTSFSLSFWFQTADQTYADFFNGTISPYVDGLTLTLNEYITGELYFTMRGNMSSDRVELRYTNSGLLNNQWHHLTVTISQTSKVLDLYIDAVKVKSVSFSGKNPDCSPSDPTKNYMGEFYEGKLDEVRFYSRILNQQEINVLAGKTNPSSVYFPLQKSLVATIPNPFSENLVITLNDGNDFLSSVSISDIHGKLIETLNLKSNTSFCSMPFCLNPGVYFIRVTTSNGMIEIHKVLNQ